jgi:hypothetical protein
VSVRPLRASTRRLSAPARRLSAPKGRLRTKNIRLRASMGRLTVPKSRLSVKISRRRAPKSRLRTKNIGLSVSTISLRAKKIWLRMEKNVRQIQINLAENPGLKRHEGNQTGLGKWIGAERYRCPEPVPRVEIEIARGRVRHSNRGVIVELFPCESSTTITACMVKVHPATLSPHSPASSFQAWANWFKAACWRR